MLQLSIIITTGNLMKNKNNPTRIYSCWVIFIRIEKQFETLFRL